MLLSLLGIAVVSANCASTGATPKPFPVPAPPPVGRAADPPGAGPAAAPREGTHALVGTALELRGVRYLNGGASPSGFDCSGFTQYVFARYGMVLPRQVRDQFKEGKTVKPDEIRPGDLIFFTTIAPGASHVGIAIGGDAFVHAPSTTGVVRVEQLGSRYWYPRLVGIRRMTGRITGP